jgi:signal transduction histidine kinase
LEQLGLVAVLQATSTEFTGRTGLPVKLTTAGLTARLPADAELALYRIFQEALKNVELYARARRITVTLAKRDGSIQLKISDDGIGFDAGQHAARQNKNGNLGLLGMRERAAYVGGGLKVKSARRAGTEIEVRIPLRNAREDRR